MKFDNQWNVFTWRKELHKCRDKRLKKKRPQPCDLVNDYTSHSSIHGIRYISNIKSNILEKTFWLMALLLCSIAACMLVGQLWKRYRTIPTVLVVKDTHLPLYLFPFPSITICPANKVKKSKAMEYFSRYVNETTNLEEPLLHLMSTLSMMQQPSYHRMKPHIRKSEHLFLTFMDINITDFMITVLPECSELFALCNWHGEKVNCCEVFSLQRTEEGFCFSFNSLTSEGGKHCPLSEVLENEGIVEEDDIMYEGCQLRRNTAVGTVTGLEVFMKKYNISESLQYGQHDLNGSRVIIHTSYEYPNAGDGIWMMEEQGIRISIMIYPYITVTSDTVKDLDIYSRGCVFPDEMDLYIYHVYTESSCLIECRLKYLSKACNCHMYYFPPPDDGKPLCGTMNIDCILKASSFMRLLQPPMNTPGFDSAISRQGLNCSHCIPTCYETTHDLEIHFVQDPQKLSHMYYGHLDVTYGNLGATKYQRDITFTWTDLLVSLGGVANLFLGFSLLSVIECIYWCLKIIFMLSWKQYQNCKSFTKVTPITTDREDRY